MGLPGRGLCVIALCAVVCGGASAQMSDDDARFVDSLGEAGAEVDSARLARWLFGTASTLEGGKTGVRLLQDKVAIRDASLDRIRKEIRGHFDRYAQSADRFRRDSENLLDWPDSRPFLFRALMNGNSACLQLHAYGDLVARFGVGPAQREGLRSSVEACERFRAVAFQPAVVDLIERTLRGVDDTERELSELQVELRELERLLQDLRRIDVGD